MFSKYLVMKLLTITLIFITSPYGNASKRVDSDDELSQHSQVKTKAYGKKEKEAAQKKRHHGSTPSSSSSSSSASTARDQPKKEKSRQKRPRISEILREEHSQVYAIPTYDATFKHLMTKEEICRSFFRAFIPEETVTELERLDDHLRPFKEHQRARAFVNDEKSKKVVKKINDLLEEGDVQDEEFHIAFKDTQDEEEKVVADGGEFIKGLARIYGDILKGYPQPLRNSQVDWICKINDDYYALVEVQVVPQDFWDQRALAYAANIYGRQLREGQGWEQIKKVICINLLGGGPDDQEWPKRTGFSKLTVKDQNNKEIEDGIEILQYPLFYDDLKKEVDKRVTEEGKQEYLDWLDFFEHAHYKTESEVEEIESEAVKKAYELIKTATLPKKVKEEYHKQEEELFAKYSQHTEYLKKKAKNEGIAEEKINTAKNLLRMKCEIPMIMKATGLPEEQIKKMQEAMEDSTVVG